MTFIIPVSSSSAMKTKFLAVMGCWTLTARPAMRTRDRSRFPATSAMGTTPRVNAYEVVYIFTAGRYDIDTTRIYMPFIEAQSFFNKEGRAAATRRMPLMSAAVRMSTCSC